MTAKKYILNTIMTEDFNKMYTSRIEKMIPLVSKQEKMKDEDIIIPSVNDYKTITQFNYNVQQLKIIAKKYKLKITGNKNQLFSRIFTFLYLSYYVTKIQKRYRGQLQRIYNSLHGPAWFERELCTNSCDFVTMEPIKEIPFYQFISFKDMDNFIYGFDIASLYNLYLKSNDLVANKKKITIMNPYNRANFPEYVIHNIKKIMKLSKILNKRVNLIIEDEPLVFSETKTIELRCLTLFQNIGHYSEPSWFLSLNRNKLTKFIRELADIWNYRAQLSMETKCNIYPPYGDPFVNTQFIQLEENTIQLQIKILTILEKITNSGIDADSKSLGGYFVLSALTLVSESAALALPWLYQSVC